MTGESADHTQSIRNAHQQAIKHIFKSHRLRIGSVPRKSSSKASLSTDDQLREHLNKLRNIKIGLQAKLRERTTLHREQLSDKIQDIVEKASECINRPYLHRYDRGSAGQIAEMHQKSPRGRKRTLTSSHESDTSTACLQNFDNDNIEALMKERKMRKLMGAHRLTGLSIFTILDEKESWYLGTRIDVTGNDGLFTPTKSVYYAFFQLQSKRWILKNHTLPHCLQAGEFVEKYSKDFDAVTSAGDKLWSCRNILKGLYDLVFAYQLRSNSVDALREIESKHQEGVHKFRILNISTNESFTLLSFEIIFSFEEFIKFQVRMIYADKSRALPGKVRLTSSDLNLDSETKADLLSACAYELKNTVVNLAISKLASIIEVICCPKKKF